MTFSLPSGLQSCTRNYLLHREERKHQPRARLLTEAILRRHWLAVKGDAQLAVA